MIIRITRTALAASTSVGFFILGAAPAHTATKAIFWISLSICGLSAAIGPFSRSLHRGTASAPWEAIMNLSNQISGIAAPIVTGFLITEFHSFAVSFAVAVAYLAVGIAGYVFFLGEIRRFRAGLAKRTTTDLHRIASCLLVSYGARRIHASIIQGSGWPRRIGRRNAGRQPKNSSAHLWRDGCSFNHQARR
jgi:hypothetical protein